MMDDADLLNWLMEQGGPAVQLRISARQSMKDPQNAVSTLLDIEEVHTVLNYLDGFKTQLRDAKTLEHLIHYYKETCIDQFFPMLLDMGFRAGIRVFDEKMQAVRDVFMHLLHADDDIAYGYTLMLHRFFFMAGYAHQEIIESMERRLHAVHKVAVEKIFEIYQDESKLPKKPLQWVDVGVVRDDLNPFSKTAGKPLPTIYDISALAYYQDIYRNSDNQAQIDNIITYILNPEFQKLRGGYGLLWVKARRIYHACGWSPTLPRLETDSSKWQARAILQNLNMLSHFRTAHQSDWIKNCLTYAAQFKTEKGTYIFPKEYLSGKYIDQAFLNASDMKLKRTEREIKVRELVSTLNMLEINRRISG